jgi:hypothetical protein
MDIHVQRAARPGAGEGAFRLLQIGDQPQAALVIGLPVRRGADMARGALEEPDPQPGFQRPCTASVTEDLGIPRSSAAWVKLRRSTILVKTRIASKRSIIRPVE